MTLLPKPYVDEIVGSIMLRGRIHLGMALKPFLNWVYDSENGRSTCSFVLEPALGRVSAHCGLSARELLEQHTVFPYVVAFLPSKDVFALERKLLNPQVGQVISTAALAQNVVSSSPFRRFCPVCARDEKQRLGETYWHRTHQLPGTELCEVHDVPLIRTGIRMSVSAREDELSLPPVPAARPRAVATTAVPLPTAKAITQTNQRVLSNPVEVGVAWCNRYRQDARSIGFVRPSGELATGSLAKAIEAHYGQELLADLKCEMRTDGSRAWPALLLRPGNKEPTSVVRHVLLDVFLKSYHANGPTTRALQRKAYPTRNYGVLDTMAVKTLRRTILAAAKQGTRLTVRELLDSADICSAYLHGRERFPLCGAVVQEFRKSEQSERQLGGRECWRRRTPSRWGLPSMRRPAGSDLGHASGGVGDDDGGKSRVAIEDRP